MRRREAPVRWHKAIRRREDIGHGADIEWVEKAGRKMAAEIRVSDDDGAAGADDEDEDPPSVPIPPRNGSRRTPRSWLPTTLASLFAGVVSNPITVTRRDRVFSEESLYMELLAAEHSDEEPT
ncbi:hypothetical protein B0H13DRAFT_2388451 [Mycena leptocephala]|nr:hypothetical protein B0H13DRAFT_2388451 [Mycena leptocephala]